MVPRLWIYVLCWVDPSYVARIEAFEIPGLFKVLIANKTNPLKGYFILHAL